MKDILLIPRSYTKKVGDELVFTLHEFDSVETISCSLSTLSFLLCSLIEKNVHHQYETKTFDNRTYYSTQSFLDDFSISLGSIRQRNEKGKETGKELLTIGVYTRKTRQLLLHLLFSETGEAIFPLLDALPYNSHIILQTHLYAEYTFLCHHIQQNNLTYRSNSTTSSSFSYSLHNES